MSDDGIIDFKPTGVCSRNIRFRILPDGTMSGLQFDDGCDGNAIGLSVLMEGMDAREAARRLQGIRCGRKKTSCPDQLAIAIRAALAERGEEEKDRIPGDGV